MAYALIMAGGAGTRLWPFSREKRPKQALKLVEERTLFQHAVERITPSFPAEHILVVTRKEHAPMLMEQAPSLPGENFIIEPEGRGTAPAIGLGALHVAQRDPQAVMAVLTADHFIAKPDIFRQALAAAVEAAQAGHLVTMGIQPTYPATGYGYIKRMDFMKQYGSFTAFHMERFVEKPDLSTAIEMLASGEYSWNSGMFIWQVERIFEEFKRQMPAFYDQMQQIKFLLDTPAYADAVQEIWPKVQKQTIDYGIMEGAQQRIVFPVDIGWADVGSWKSLIDLLPADEDGNIFSSHNIAIDTHNTFSFGEKRLIATIGIHDLIIVDTEDALLICDRDREQEVREIVRILSEQGKNEYL
jgi:mannose-1-phosphate guanylyltransferase